MDHTLRCNSLKCRKQLTERAVVTTCSHLFCLDCTNALGLAGSSNANRTCPACNARLGNADDAVVTSLNPSEDYKTSVLSGLSPCIIMECAGRGLAFYSYQTTQEVVYQEYLAKSLTEKYSTLNTQVDQIVNDANAEISNLRNKLEGIRFQVKMDQERLMKRAEDAEAAYQQKTRQHQKAQQMYDHLHKELSMLDSARAAEIHADESIQSTSANRSLRIGNIQPRAFAQPQPRHGGLLHTQMGGGKNASNIQQPSHSRMWDAGDSDGTPNRNRYQLGSPQVSRMQINGPDLNGQAWNYGASSVPPHPSRQPLGALDRNVGRHVSPAFHQTRDAAQSAMHPGSQTYKPARQSSLNASMMP